MIVRASFGYRQCIGQFSQTRTILFHRPQIKKKMENEQFKSQLHSVLEQLNESMKILERFEESKRESLYMKLQDVIESFRSFERMVHAGEITGSVPLNLLDIIDQGKNPDSYANWLIKEVDNIQEKVQKKQKWMQHLKDCLDPLIELNFPNGPEE